MIIGKYIDYKHSACRVAGFVVSMSRQRLGNRLEKSGVSILIFLFSKVAKAIAKWPRIIPVGVKSFINNESFRVASMCY